MSPRRLSAALLLLLTACAGGPPAGPVAGVNSEEVEPGWVERTTARLREGDPHTLGATAAAVGAAALYNSPYYSGPQAVTSKNIKLGPTTFISLDKLVAWGAWTAAAWLVLDPLAPNWEIEEAAFPDKHFHLALKMKRIYSGGAGEAQQVFRHRAQEIMRRSGYKAFDVVEYSESLESSLLGSQRVGRGVIRLKDPA